MNLDQVPAPDELTADWWEATREHRLTVQSCGSCGHVQHPPRGLCTACGATEGLAQVDAAGTATVDSFTVVHPAPPADLETPYVVARVRLAEGPILLTNLMTGPPLHPAAGRDWAIGDPVAVAWADLPDGRALPVFTPATEENA